MSKIHKYELVYAKKSDCDILFEWINDVDVRVSSFNSSQNPVRYEDHVKWFNDKMGSKDSTIYIFKVDKENIGLIRLEKMKNDIYIINYSIAKEHRRKGYAIILLRLIKEKYNTKLLVGKVKKDNIASIKSFIKAEYIMKEESDMYIFYSHDK